MSEKKEMLINLWFNDIRGVGPTLRKRLRQCFGSPAGVYEATLDELAGAIGEIGMAYRIFSSRDLEKYELYTERLKNAGVRVIYPEHPLYPNKLFNIYDPPDILFVKGIMWDEAHINNNKSLGIVGARKASAYGREITFMFARELAARKITIISGLARGIDSEAHRGALAADGYTIAVLGCGINVTYPQENAGLYRAIEKSGAIISEYGLDVDPCPGYFPIRNRIISGLSDGILVVEARRKSGSLITADCALEQGRQVYAVPGRAYDSNSDGTNNLIKQGAMCVTGPADILNDMGEEDSSEMAEDVCDIIDDTKNSLAPLEKKVYSCLGLEPVYIEDIIKQCGIGITEAITTLYKLEEEGRIKQPVQGYYITAL